MYAMFQQIIPKFGIKIERESKRLRRFVKFIFPFLLTLIVFVFFTTHQAVYADIPASSYASATISNPSSNLTNFTLMIDLSRMPVTWWNTVNTSDGTKGRTAKDDGTELASDWISFDNVGQTGWLRVMWSGSLASSGTQILRIYPPISTNSSYGVSDTYGSNNAYASHWQIYYSLDEAVNNDVGGYVDRTNNARHGTGVSMASTAVAGKVNKAAVFDGTADYIKKDGISADFTQGTVLSWSTNNASGIRTYAELSPNSSSNRILFYSNATTLIGFIGAGNVAQKTSAITTNALSHMSFTWNTTSQEYELYVNGSAQSADLNGSSVSLTTVSRDLTVSSYFNRSGYFLNGYQDEFQVHSTTLSSAWIAEEYAQTNNNATFWGNWTFFGDPSAPTLIYPTSASGTNDNTPTLSAQYTSTTGIGTVNYRISSSNASDCLSNTNIVVSGTTSQTSTTNEATTFTPNSSIGSDGVYYWCAQNNNGTNTSDWTTMGTFTLNTTDISPPTVPGTPTTTSNTTNNLPVWTWMASTDSGIGLHATPYTVQWSQDQNFVSGVSTSTSNTNSFTHSIALADGTWYFKVSAKDALNHESAYSSAGPIVINTALTPSFTVTYTSTDGNGVKSYNMSSTYNGDGQHVLRILEPNNPAPGVAHTFIYVLPVEAELNTSFGNGLETVRLLDAQNTYNATIIVPSFKIMPWYADHATNPDYRYDSFMTLELQRWVKANLATSGNEQHWLLGFSKSGFGGADLLFRHPDYFTRGAFWDFPANMSLYTDFSANTNYGTQANFDNNYRLTSTFLDNIKAPFLIDNRVWINGYSLFRTDMSDFDILLTTKSILHTNDPEVSRSHIWGSGWVAPALADLYAKSILYSTAIVTTDSGIDTSWHNSDVVVTLACNDSSGGSCANTYYTTDGTDPTTSSSQGTSLTVSTNGEHTIKYFSINNTGLRESIKTATNSVKIDKTAPTISAVSSTPTSTGATITWTTGEDSSSKVDYGLTNSYGSSTAEADTTTRVSSHSVTLSSLPSCTTYHYRVRSIDEALNETIGSDNTFITTGCAGSSNVSSSTTTTSSSSLAPSCTDQASGAKTPWLYGAIAQDTSSIILYFTEADSPVTKYVLEYGIKSGEYQYGVQDMGVNERNQMTYLVKSLSPNTTYYFKIRGQNGCATGEWSNELSAKTKGNVSLNQLDFTTSELTPVIDDTPKTNSCQTYTVKSGDSLWLIAKNLLSDGKKYKEIVEQNKETYLSLSTSNNLNAGWELKVNCGDNNNQSSNEVPVIENNSVEGYKVKVKVLDSDKKPVEGAKVTIHSKVQEMITDKDGIAQFTNVEAGDHKVLIAYNNFEGEQSVNLTGDVKEFALNVTVQQKPFSLSPLAWEIIILMGTVISILALLLIKVQTKK